MKALVIYTSQTGFTKRYAGWLAEKLGGEVGTEYADPYGDGRITIIQ